MANTKLSFLADKGQTLTVFLFAYNGATGSPNVLGYSTTESEDGLYVSTDIPEALDGEFYVQVLDQDSELAYVGYVTLEDTALTYRCYDYTNSAGSSASEIASLVIAGLSSLPPTVVSNWDSSDNSILLYQDDDYNAADGTQIDILVPIPSGIDPLTCTAHFKAVNDKRADVTIVKTPSLIEIASQWYVRLEFTTDDTATVGFYAMDCKIKTTAGRKVTRFTGELEVRRTYTRPA